MTPQLIEDIEHDIAMSRYKLSFQQRLTSVLILAAGVKIYPRTLVLLTQWVPEQQQFLFMIANQLYTSCN